jgi:putative membrane protein
MSPFPAPTLAASAPLPSRRRLLQGASAALLAAALGPRLARAQQASPASSPSPAIGALDAEWLRTAIQGDRFEIAGGQLAQAKGSAQGVKDFGAKLVADHTTSLNDAIALAQRFGLQVPDRPAPPQQWALQVLQTFSGAAFDQQYVALEVADHQQDIEEAKTEIAEGATPEIQAAASTDLPVLQQHLALAQGLQQRGAMATPAATPAT